MLTAAGCGPPSGAETDNTDGGAVAEQPHDACGGLELGAAAELLGCTEVRITDALRESSAVHCVLACGDDPDRILAFSVETFPDADVAEAALGGMRAALGRSGSVRDVTGIGDDAWVTDGDSGSLAARSGATIVEVTRAPDPGTRDGAAAALLSR